MRACKSGWTRGSAKRRPEARWPPAATGLLIVWKVSSVSMQSWLKHSTLSKVLLDPRVLVIDVQGWCDILCDNPGAEPSRCFAGDLAIEDQLHFLWATQIEVLADHLLEEQAAMHRSI